MEELGVYFCITNSASRADIIDQNGVHVNGEDPLDIAWGIKETLRNPEKARNWGGMDAKRVLEYFM